MAILLFGADGALGAEVARAFARRGVTVEGVDPRTDPVLPAGATVVSASPAAPDVDAAIEAVVAGGGGVLEAVPDPRRFETLIARHDSAARRSGAVVVPAAGWAFALGDLLVARAADGIPEVRHVHVTYFVPGVRSVLARATPGWRRDVLALFARDVSVRVDGQAESERLAETRRLAWFPRPVGPHHAVAVPGTEALTVPRHVAGVRTVRTYLALRSWLAEAVQGLGSVVRTGRGGAWLDRRIAATPRPATAEARATERWAVVAELADADGQVTRSWAYGRDRTAAAGAVLATVATALGSAKAAPGVRSAAEVVDAGAVLDDMAAHEELRWAVSRPDGP